MFTDGEIAILCFVVIPACYGYPLHKNNSTSLRTAPQNPTSRDYHDELSAPSVNSYIHHIPQRRHYEGNYGQHYEDDHYENPIHDGYPHNNDHEEHSHFPDHDWHHDNERHFHDHHHHGYPEIGHDHYDEDENNHYDYREPYYEDDHHSHHRRHHHGSPWTFDHYWHHPHYHHNNDYYHNGEHHYHDEYPHSHDHHHEYHSRHYPEYNSWHKPLFEDQHHDEHEFTYYNDRDNHGGYSWGHIDTSPYDYTAIVHGYEGHQDGYAYPPDYHYDDHHPLDYDIGLMGHHVDYHLGDLHHLDECHGYWYQGCFPHLGGERGKAEQNANGLGSTQFQSSGFFQNPSSGPAGSYPEFSKASLSVGGPPGSGPASPGPPASGGGGGGKGGAFRKPGLGGHGPYPGPIDKNASPQVPPKNPNPAEVLTSSQL